MGEDQKGYRIVVGVDFSEGSAQAVRDALWLATRLAGAELHFAAVLDDAHLERAREMENGRLKLLGGERRLVSFVRGTADAMRLLPASLLLVFHVRIGKPAEALTQVAFDVDASLIVVGTSHRSRAMTLLLGSVAETLLREGRFPLLVARPRDLEGLERSSRPDPRRPGEDLSSDREDMLRSSERVDFTLPEPHIAGLL